MHKDKAADIGIGTKHGLSLIHIEMCIRDRDKEVVETVMKFVDKLPTKGLVRVYNSVHPIIDIEGHMAQSGKKNLALFQSLMKEMASKAKAAGKTDVPNLQESVVEVHIHGGMKRKAKLLPRVGKGKDVKKVRAALLGAGPKRYFDQPPKYHHQLH
ncbi:hypothetical protein DEO72_LG6g1520 [Vigna unguiculata]|uniref:Uncharacterized protein n=1 Tax=Vigna unguiculata TaxID=3917 RepID=A0A4D6M802_VIGUN|nr:hypothetical protein DEO72_LG6g1520 [Vigna unguiculata]